MPAVPNGTGREPAQLHIQSASLASMIPETASVRGIEDWRVAAFLERPLYGVQHGRGAAGHVGFDRVRRHARRSVQRSLQRRAFYQTQQLLWHSELLHHFVLKSMSI
ncbi:hypothetical protein M728_001824 [Ensifer sp. WSM1721]